MKDAEIVLGETKYSVPPLTLGQQEALALYWEAQEKSTAKDNVVTSTLHIASVLLENAKPAIEDIRKIPAHPDELTQAVVTIFRHNGLEKQKEAGGLPIGPKDNQ